LTKLKPPHPVARSKIRTVGCSITTVSIATLDHRRHRFLIEDADGHRTKYCAPGRD
jgi:hypothetical protein